ncbi:MAG: dTDP-4-amino-4,6-dideoxygalactose transaminase [Planctomycetota bacterium]|nr:dTDP-4-amino-4,6-dideoxygalactose transaminase [Planctomycetota bacterium]
MTPRIPFNRPFVAGKELFYIAQAVTTGKLAGDGQFTKACAELMEREFNIEKVLMTPSCTAALEMAAMLCELQPGDEVILPSYTFVSTANAVVRLGVRPAFIDVRPDTLNMNEALIEAAITERTKAILPVHYAGVSCEMDRIMEIAAKHKLLVIEDAAQGVNASYHGRALGSIGQLGCYSFHETKNYICGEGGALCINDKSLTDRAEIIREKGTNRSRFFRGMVDKYTWVDVGSSYIPSEISSAFLFAQLELRDAIAQRRRDVYKFYQFHLQQLEQDGLVQLPTIPEGCQTNYHMFYMLMPSQEMRSELIAHLKQQGIMAVFHYVPLHTAPVGQQYGYRQGDLPVTEDLSDRLVRLPFYHDLTEADQMEVVTQVNAFMKRSAQKRVAA